MTNFLLKVDNCIFTTYILKIIPNVKLIVLFRNPVDRAYSHYLHSKRDDHEDLEFKEALMNESSRLKKYEENGDYLSYLRQSYVSQGLYSEMLERYLEYFSLDNFLFIHFEDEFIKKREIAITGHIPVMGFRSHLSPEKIN